MKMTSEAFHTWSQHLQLSPETEALIASIRSSRPIRHVSGRSGNITGRYPRPKMGMSIQFESDRVEFWALYTLERDEDVLEYYEQSSRIPLSYRAASGRRTTQWHTPNFFVLRRKSAGWEEWKQEQMLASLAEAQPVRYQSAANGQWRCPPGERYAEQLGLTYRFRSSAEFRPLEIQNLKFLQDFWAHEVPPNEAQETLVLTHLQAHPGILLSELLAAYPDLSVDVVWTLLGTRRIFTDLSASLLMRHESVALYAEVTQVPNTFQSETATLPPSLTTALLAWDGRLWHIEEWGKEIVQLRPEVGEPLALPRVELDHLKQEGSLWIVGEADPSPMTPEVRQILAKAGSKAQQSANQRMIHMLAYARGETTTAPKRSVQRWWKAYQEAQETHRCGYLGLLDRVTARGNRNPRIEPASLQVLEAALQAHYAAPQGKSAAAVYRLYREQCKKFGLSPVSQPTFYRVRARFTTNEVESKRRGTRAAYTLQAFSWLDQTTPRHGERPFALAHLDHTKLDILLVSSLTGKPLGKPWATLLTDAYSRRILACYLTYDPPSYRSVMMALRICVQRHQRLPQECFVDRGSEFGSVYFETLLTRYSVTKKDRPAAQPRTGSVIERLFGTATTQLLHQLSGNTQATKHSRQMTRAVDPRRLAVWTLERFAARFCEYAYEVYDQMDHPALGQSPREAFAQGMQLAGMRTHRLIPYSEEFLILTCPTTRTNYAKLDAARGVVVNGLRYYHPLMRFSKEAGKPVAVRYEPFDMSRAYAFVDGQWLICTADAFLQVQGRSEREWGLILDEWREQQRVHQRKRVGIDSAKLAAFLEEFLTEEALGVVAKRFAREERIAFVATLKYLLERVPLEVDLNTSLSSFRWWATGCVGCIGVLKDWLVDAVAATLIQNGTSLTEAVLTATMPHPARRLSLEMEARAGEHNIARHNSESAKQFQALVKKPTKGAKEEAKQATGNGSGVPHAGQADQMKEHSAATVLPMPQVTPKPTRLRVGQRAPERDPVGNTPSPAQKSVGCSFTEVISVTHAQAEEAGVSRFERPTCLATRTIPFTEGSVKFPWHPKRTTVTPHHGLRWIKREIWRLSEK